LFAPPSVKQSLKRHWDSAMSEAAKAAEARRAVLERRYEELKSA
jgi:hypothetical protein